MILKGRRYIDAQGMLTSEGWQAFNALASQVAALEAKVAAAAAVANAAGGATQDAEARAQLAAIKAALS